MKLPFVSRETLELALAQVTYFRDKAEVWEARYVEAVTPKVPERPTPQPVDPVTLAIREASAGNAALRNHLSLYARAAREKGTPDETIVAEIRAYADGVPVSRTPATEQRARDEANAALAELLDEE